MSNMNNNFEHIPQEQFRFVQMEGNLRDKRLETKAQATIRHAMRNCFVVVVPAIFGQFIGILGGSLIIEKIFAIPGVGGLTINAINGRDYPIFMLTTVFYTAIGLAGGLVVDISYGFIDPRIRMGSKK